MLVASAKNSDPKQFIEKYVVSRKIFLISQELIINFTNLKKVLLKVTLIQLGLIQSAELLKELCNL